MIKEHNLFEVPGVLPVEANSAGIWFDCIVGSCRTLRTSHLTGKCLSRRSFPSRRGVLRYSWCVTHTLITRAVHSEHAICFRHPYPASVAAEGSSTSNLAHHSDKLLIAVTYIVFASRKYLAQLIMSLLLLIFREASGVFGNCRLRRLGLPPVGVGSSNVSR